jgi:phosphoenolpyruvate carboxykinase (ATP)
MENNDTIVSEDKVSISRLRRLNIILIARFTPSHKVSRSVCRASLPCAPIVPASSALFSYPLPNFTRATTARRLGQLHRCALSTARPTSAHFVRDVVRMAPIKEASDPVIRTASPAPLAQDFARQQVSKQQRSNFHSTSIASALSNTMVPPAVNQTNLHPGGLK